MGRLISGSTPLKSLYDLYTLHRAWPGCRTLCGSLKDAVKTLNNEQIQIMSKLIDEKYEVEWIVDNLPVVMEVQAQNPEGKKFVLQSPFFPLGKSSDKLGNVGGTNTSVAMNVLFNHHKITVKYQKMKRRGLRIVGSYMYISINIFFHNIFSRSDCGTSFHSSHHLFHPIF